MTGDTVVVSPEEEEEEEKEEEEDRVVSRAPQITSNTN